MTVDLTKDELLLIHQAIIEKYLSLLDDQLGYDVDTQDKRKKYKTLDDKLRKLFEQNEE